MQNSKERFTNRVETYTKYRPGYPSEAIDYLYETVGLTPDSRIADIGAGTGIFTRLLLERGSEVTAVEPNAAMREAAERDLAGFGRVRFVSAAAEQTGLPDGSVDCIVCAQSFHWFDRPAAQAEFRRILRPGGKAALIWNSRLVSGTPFLEQYEALLRTYGTDYQNIDQKNITTEQLAAFFQPGAMQLGRFANRQLFDLDGLIGRMLSSSYIPMPGDPGYGPMMEALERLFADTNVNGTVSFDYETLIYWGDV